MAERTFGPAAAVKDGPSGRRPAARLRRVLDGDDRPKNHSVKTVDGIACPLAAALTPQNLLRRGGFLEADRPQ